MESLESKLDRLSPEQRKEIENFADFLLSRTGPACTLPDPTCNPLLVLNIEPPTLPLAQPAEGEDTLPVCVQDLTLRDDPIEPATVDTSVPDLFQEIRSGSDRITRTSMDYDQFEHPASPATEAVKKVKRRIIAREEQEKPHHLLDWVD